MTWGFYVYVGTGLEVFIGHSQDATMSTPVLTGTIVEQDILEGTTSVVVMEGSTLIDDLAATIIWKTLEAESGC